MEKKAILKQYAFRNMYDINKIIFLGKCDEIPSNTHDFSQDNDESVVGWKNDSNALYIASTCSDKIIANEDSSFMFFNCINLRHIDGLKHLDTSMVRDMSCMFSWCEKLEELDLSSFDTHNVVDMGEMFAYCFNLKELNVSGFDTSKVIYMQYMFYHCKEMRYLNLSSFDTSKVKNMYRMFCDCSKLRKLNFHFDIFSSIDVTSMFHNCSVFNQL